VEGLNNLRITKLTDEEHKALAAQLRKPTGELGVKVANFMNEGNALLNRNTISQISSKSINHVVEIGMGNGKFVQELFDIQELSQYSGCDYSAGMVQLATELNENLVSKGSVQFIHCNATQLPFQSGSIDVIFTVNTIYFWDDVDSVLQEFHRVLKPNGQLLLGLRPKHLMQHYPFVQYGFRMFSSEDVVKELTKHNYLNLEAKTISEPDFETDELTMPVESLVISGYKR
jgi:ubiquinone/menaquinone biosynthesis C-methylase UbiE